MLCIRLPLEQVSHNQMCHPFFYGPEHRKDSLILNHLQNAKNIWQFDPFYPCFLSSLVTKGKYKREIRSHKFICELYAKWACDISEHKVLLQNGDLSFLLCTNKHVQGDLKWGIVEKYKSCVIEAITLGRLNEVEASHL